MDRQETIEYWIDELNYITEAAEFNLQVEIMRGELDEEACRVVLDTVRKE